MKIFKKKVSVHKKIVCMGMSWIQLCHQISYVNKCYDITLSPYFFDKCYEYNFVTKLLRGGKKIHILSLSRQKKGTLKNAIDITLSPIFLGCDNKYIY